MSKELTIEERAALHDAHQEARKHGEEVFALFKKNAEILMGKHYHCDLNDLVSEQFAEFVKRYVCYQRVIIDATSRRKTG